jgi:hypothetical protein
VPGPETLDLDFPYGVTELDRNLDQASASESRVGLPLRMTPFS